jgi:hypothetical protein
MIRITFLKLELNGIDPESIVKFHGRLVNHADG